MSLQNSDSSTWWEFYAVRYGMGSVIGGAIFYFLANKITALKPMLFLAADGKIDIPQIILLAAYGLTYCYIASAPILVFHASRFLLDPALTTSKKRILFLIFSILIPFTAVYLINFFSKASWSFFYWLIACLYALMVWLQFFSIIICLIKSNDMYIFYKNLATNRVKSDAIKITDSYRHLREHGNSFFIVVLEILLCVIILTFFGIIDGLSNAPMPLDEEFKILFGFLLLWMSPAALVWLVGTLFERHLKDDTFP